MIETTGNAIEAAKPEASIPAEPELGERRFHRRYAFTAAVEATELKSRTEVRGRTADIAKGGCYVDTNSPFPVDALIKLRFINHNRSCETQAKVVYALPGKGMGLTFIPGPHGLPGTIANWIGRLSGELQPEKAEPVVAEQVPAEPMWSKEQSFVLSELLLELMHQGVVSDAKGKAMLQKLFSLSPVEEAKKAITTSEDSATAATPGTERRTHPRRKIGAVIEVREAGTGKQIDARLADLSLGGCFLETECPLPVGTAAEIVIDKEAQSVQALAKVSSILPNKGMGLEFTAVGPGQFRILGGWLDESLQKLWLATRRQQGQRIPLRAPVRVSGYADHGGRFTEDTHTLEVSAQGGLLLLSVPVKEGQRLVLSHLQTKETLECLVVSCKAVRGNRLLAGVAFVQPNVRFWLVSFPADGVAVTAD